MLIAFFLSFLFALMATVPTIYLAKRLNLVTDVKKRLHPAHTHKGIIPRGGGVPIFLSILLTTIILLPLSKIIIGILLSCFLLVILGLLDDQEKTGEKNSNNDFA